MRKLKKTIRTFLAQVRGFDSAIFLMTIILLFVGLLFSTSASMSTSSTVGSIFNSAIKQLAIIFVSYIAYCFFSNIYVYEEFVKARKVLISIGFVLLLVAWIYCLVNGAINNNYSWFFIGPISVQPSEFAKCIMILEIALALADQRFKNFKPYSAIKEPLIVFIGFVGIVFFLQKDAGSALVIAMIGCICFLFIDNPLFKNYQRFVVLLGILAIFAYVFFMSKAGQDFLIKMGFDTIAARFEAVLNPSYYSDATREIFYSLVGIAKGNYIGVGLGESVQKMGYLVSSDADYIFAIIVEESGLIGILFVFAPYTIIVSRLLFHARTVKRNSDRVILIGTASYLVIHAVLNIGGVSGLLPLTGIPLLLLSKGGSSMLSTMIMLGICQGVIARYEKEMRRDDIIL